MLLADYHSLEIFQLDMIRGDVHVIPYTPHARPYYLTYDPEGKLVYWTDLSAKILRRVRLDGSNPTDLYRFDESKECCYH